MSLQEINNHIDFSKSGCLNVDGELRSAFDCTGGFQSDCDSEMLLFFSFHQKVKLLGISIHAPEDCGPHKICFYSNNNSIDFGNVSEFRPNYELTIEKGHLAGEVIKIPPVVLQNLISLAIYFPSNQSGEAETNTIIRELSFLGVADAMADVSEVKKQKVVEH